MSKDEALKLALEFVEKMLIQQWRARDIYNLRDAIKDALEIDDEPVGWAENGVINWLADKQFNHTSFLYATPAKVWTPKIEQHFDKQGILMIQTIQYSPQGEKLIYPHEQQRTWIGLTDEEIDAIYEQHHNQYGECESVNLGYERAIEAKLKDKNNE
jgi:hypothetical protein